MSENPWAIWAKGGQFSEYVEGSIVPKAWLPAIGYVIVSFSTLDSTLDLAIADLLGSEPKKEIGLALAAAIPNYRPRIELFQRLIPLRITDEDDQKKLLRVATEIEKVADERHRLIHDYMAGISFGTAFPEPILSLHRKEMLFAQKPKPTAISKSSLKELGMRATDLSYRLQRFGKKDPDWKSGAQFPWRDRPRKQSH